MLGKGKLLPVCIICHHTPSHGIRGGLFLVRRFICFPCEAEILRVGVREARYEYIKNQLKKIWA